MEGAVQKAVGKFCGVCPGHFGQKGIRRNTKCFRPFWGRNPMEHMDALHYKPAALTAQGRRMRHDHSDHRFLKYLRVCFCRSSAKRKEKQNQPLGDFFPEMPQKCPAFLCHWHFRRNDTGKCYDKEISYRFAQWRTAEMIATDNTSAEVTPWRTSCHLGADGNTTNA